MTKRCSTCGKPVRGNTYWVGENGVRRHIACPGSQPLTKEQRREVKSLVEDSGYTRAEAIRIVLAGGI